MSINDWILFFIIVALAITSGVSIFWAWEWKRRHDEAVELWLKESESKNNIITSLKETIEALKARDKIIKIEKFYAQPKEISSKLTIQSEVIDDEKMFKDVIIHELSRNIAEEIALDPYFYKVFFSFNAFDNCETVEIRTRILPYMEAAEWKNFKEEDK